MTVYILECLWILIRQLVGRDADNWSVSDMQLMDGDMVVAFKYVI